RERGLRNPSLTLRVSGRQTRLGKRSPKTWPRVSSTQSKRGFRNPSLTLGALDRQTSHNETTLQIKTHYLFDAATKAVNNLTHNGARSRCDVTRHQRTFEKVWPWTRNSSSPPATKFPVTQSPNIWALFAESSFAHRRSARAAAAVLRRS